MTRRQNLVVSGHQTFDCDALLLFSAAVKTAVGCNAARLPSSASAFPEGFLFIRISRQAASSSVFVRQIYCPSTAFAGVPVIGE